MSAMITQPRHVLVVGADDSAVERVAPLLRRSEFEVHTVNASPFVLDLVLGTSFELLIVGYPLKTLSLDELMAAIRGEGSNCRNAGVLLLADPGRLDEAASWVDRGANRVVAADWADGRLFQAVGDLLQGAPRVALRALVQVDIEADPGELLRTENVSASGMLLCGDRRLRPGQRFDFMLCLPDEDETVRGVAEVVRRTATDLAGSGAGVRFVSFKEEGRRRLESYIGRRLRR